VTNNGVDLPVPRAAAPVLQFLHWGQLVVDAHGARLATIVGSCVALCLWDPTRRVGGMTHYLLPDAPRVHSGIDKPWSYGELAMPELLARLVDLGVPAHRLIAKVYGGAAITKTDDQAGPGARNAALARRWLGEHGLQIVSEDLGGRRGRKLVFDTASGEVSVRLL
jgi:chemotaxis protein CheD